MSTQLHLIELDDTADDVADADQAPAEATASNVKPIASARGRRSARSAAASRASRSRNVSQSKSRTGVTASAGSYRELDEQTCERGLVGVAEARQALREASRRVAAREAVRRAERDQELVRFASKQFQRGQDSSPGPSIPKGPGGHAAA